MVAPRLPRRPYKGEMNSLFGDLESAMSGLDTSIEEAVAFEAEPTHWNDPPPTTLAEAVARLAAATPGA